MADLASLIIGSFGSLVAVWLGSRFAEVKRVREQSWDRKALAYSDILDALNEMRRYLDQAYDDAILRRDRDAQDTAARSTIYRSASDQLGKTAFRQSWILPESVHQSVMRLEKVLLYKHGSLEEDLDASSHACRIALDEIRSTAREDMSAPRLLPVVSLTRLMGK